VPRATPEALVSRIGAHLGNVTRDLTLMRANLVRAGYADEAHYLQVALLGCEAARVTIASKMSIPVDAKNVRWQF